MLSIDSTGTIVRQILAFLNAPPWWIRRGIFRPARPDYVWGFTIHCRYATFRNVTCVKTSPPSFGDRLAELLKLGEKQGKTFTCTVPQGTFIVTVSPMLTKSERRKYKMANGLRSVHIEGYYRSRGIEHQFSFDDRDGDGVIGSHDAGGVFDSAQFFICEGVEGLPDEFYRLLTEIVEDYLS